MRQAKRVLLLTLLCIAGCGYSSERDFAMRYADPTIATSAFNAAEIETMEGQIVGIDRVDIDQREGQERPAMIVRFVGNGDFPSIYLGPVDFIQDKGLDPKILSYVEIVASRVNVRGLEYVARELKIGDKNVVLRDGAGTPLWSEEGARNAINYGGIIESARQPEPLN